jgi:hypothetical protein
LVELQHLCNKELDCTEKKLKKIENKLKRRAERAHSESESVEDIWAVKEEKVSEVIGGWVDEYEEKVEVALEDLDRE